MTVFVAFKALQQRKIVNWTNEIGRSAGVEDFNSMVQEFLSFCRGGTLDLEVFCIGHWVYLHYSNSIPVRDVLREIDSSRC